MQLQDMSAIVGDIEQFLLNRPGLFVVGPDIIDVTDHARVSLVYKREVLQALWQALHDNVQLSLGDLAEIGPKFERINDIIAVSLTTASL